MSESLLCLCVSDRSCDESSDGSCDGSCAGLQEGERHTGGGGGRCGVPCDLLRPAFLILDLVHRPDCSFHVLHTHKTLVQAEVVANCILHSGIKGGGEREREGERMREHERKRER